MWDLPGPGLEPVSPALADGFSTTAPPGKPLQWGFEFIHHPHTQETATILAHSAPIPFQPDPNTDTGNH